MNPGDELLDRAPDRVGEMANAFGAATGFSPRHPVDKGLDVLGELFEGPDSPERLGACSPSSGRFRSCGLFAEDARLRATITYGPPRVGIDRISARDERGKARRLIQGELKLEQSIQPTAHKTRREERARRDIVEVFDDYLEPIQDSMATEETPWLKVICAMVGEG